MELPSHNIPKFPSAPNNAHTKKTFEEANRSAIDKKAKSSVPNIKPSCTAEVRFATAPSDKRNTWVRSSKIALLANQSEVQQNCANTIMGKTCAGGFMHPKV